MTSAPDDIDQPFEVAWIAEVVVTGEANLPPRSEQIFLVPTIVKRAGQAEAEHHAVCEEASGASGEVTFEVEA